MLNHHYEDFKMNKINTENFKNITSAGASVAELSEALKKMASASISAKKSVVLFSVAARKIDYALQNC